MIRRRIRGGTWQQSFTRLFDSLLIYRVCLKRTGQELESVNSNVGEIPPASSNRSDCVSDTCGTPPPPPAPPAAGQAAERKERRELVFTLPVFTVHVWSGGRSLYCTEMV